MAYSYGGWYDNPATGKNQRWWNGVWTNGEEPGKSSGGGGGGGGSSVDDILNNAISAFTALVPKPVKPYEEVNPFFFDEALATQAATAEYTPYYQELLSDYVSNVERSKTRSNADLKTTLDQLAAGKEYYTGTNRMLLEKAVKNTNNGYAGNGLFFSGARQKDIADINKQNALDVGNYMTNYNYNTGQATTQNTRTQEDLTTAASQYTRDTERAKEAAIAGGVLQRKGEARSEYEAARQTYYDQAGYGGLYG